MLIPSIDLMGGRTVQLRGGAEFALDAGDPRRWLERFRRVGEVAVVDLDAALDQGDNRALVEELVAQAHCRVGGGIRDLDTARRWLDLGARRIVIGTRAEPELLRQLPRERLIAALDAVHGEVVVDGWRTRTGRGVHDRLRELEPFVGGFLVTFVEREGRMTGLDRDAVRALRAAAGAARLCVAGGVRTAEEVAALDREGVDAQVGMALYTDAFHEADVLAAMLSPQAAPGQDPDTARATPTALWPTVVADEDGTALGLCWSDRESLGAALRTGTGVYRSRTRGLWHKGATSGNVQELVRVDLDCDRDALRFTVRQRGSGFCHLPQWTCFGADRGLPALLRRVAASALGGDAASYTQKLLQDPAWLAQKLREEAGELAAAATPAEVAAEAADLVYFLAVALQRHGVPVAAVERQLDRRALRLTRRPGLPKPEPAAGRPAAAAPTPAAMPPEAATEETP